MSDQGFHEIQLSGKQLVFLFMSLLVLAVVVFLLGVSVGKGVRVAIPNGPPVMADAAAADATAPATMPPPTQTSPNELDYHERLQGRGAADPAKPVEPPPPAGDAPAQASGAQATGATSQQSAAKTPAAGSAAGQSGQGAAGSAGKSAADTGKGAAAQPPPAPATKPAPAATAPASGTWSVQVMAFRSKELADNLVTKLKGKGYAAFIVSVPAPGVPYHVRVGPFAQRDDAVQTVDRLKKEKEGYTPSVIR